LRRETFPKRNFAHQPEFRSREESRNIWKTGRLTGSFPVGGFT
jgi:hypothetical protein